MHFRYKAQKASGEFYEGERDAADKFALSRELHKEGETLISAFEPHSFWALNAFTVQKLLSLVRRVSFHDKITFTRNFAGMLSAGLTVSRALSVLERQTHSKRFKTIIAGLSQKISDGESLNHALATYPTVFPPLIVSMVKAGEEGGNLSTSLLSVAEQLDRSYVLQRKLRGALIYPAIVIAVMLLTGALLFVFVVPKLTSAFKEFNVELPLSTKIVILMSDFVQAHLLLGVLLLVGFLAGVWFAARSPLGKRFLDVTLLRAPVLGLIIREVNTARVGQTLSSLLSAGVPVTAALEITADVLQNSSHRQVLLQAAKAVERGDPLSGIFREYEHIFSPFLTEMTAVGEETGKLSGMLREAGVFFEQEVEYRTRNLSTFIEPMLMIIVGIAVGFFAVAMISPAYSLMNSI